MTITNTSIKAVATGNSATTIWPFTFLIPDQASLIFKVIDVASGNETTIAPVNYTVTGFGNPAGGSITYPLSGSPLSSDYKTVVQRAVPDIQTTDLSNQGGAYPADIENALDYVTMITQQLADMQSRSIVFSIADSVAPTLPLASARANKMLGFDASGNPVVLSGITPGTTVSAAMVPVVTAPTIAAALAALGIPGSLIDLIIPAGTIWDYSLPTAPSGFQFPTGQACTSIFPVYRAALIAAGSPFGTTGVDPLMPDLRSMVVAGKSNMNFTDNGLLTGGGVLGAVLGNQYANLVVSQLPVTNLTFTGTAGGVSVNSQGGVLSGSVFSVAQNFTTGGGSFFGAIAINTLSSTSVNSTGTFTPTGTISSFGGGASHANVQPTLILNKIVKVH